MRKQGDKYLKSIEKNLRQVAEWVFIYFFKLTICAEPFRPGMIQMVVLDDLINFHDPNFRQNGLNYDTKGKTAENFRCDKLTSREKHYHLPLLFQCCYSN